MGTTNKNNSAQTAKAKGVEDRHTNPNFPKEREAHAKHLADRVAFREQVASLRQQQDANVM